MHEIGHAVGFYHEQARRDRDKYIEIIKKNIIKSDLRQFSKLLALFDCVSSIILSFYMKFFTATR